MKPTDKSDRALNLEKDSSKAKRCGDSKSVSLFQSFRQDQGASVKLSFRSSGESKLAFPKAFYVHFYVRILSTGCYTGFYQSWGSALGFFKTKSGKNLYKSESTLSRLVNTRLPRSRILSRCPRNTIKAGVLEVKCMKGWDRRTKFSLRCIIMAAMENAIVSFPLNTRTIR